MATPIKEEHRGVCVVPVRLRGVRVEFCLCRADRAGRWRFPEAPLSSGASEREAALAALSAAGIAGQLLSEEPFERQSTMRGGQRWQISVFVVVAEVCDVLEDVDMLRWCLVEEARLRVRQKSMRRLVDAVRQALDNAPRSGGREPSESRSTGALPARS